MIGNITYINNKLKRNPECPVRDIKVIQTINQEYWREWKRLIAESEHPAINTEYIGRWVVQNCKLRHFIRRQIRKVRYLRNHPDYKWGHLLYFIKHEIAVKRLRASLKQLGELRKLFYDRGERYKAKLYLEAQKGNI